jgi:hypothetical protein
LINSVAPVDNGTNIQPETRVLGTVLVSKTRIHRLGFRLEKYRAAAWTSDSLTLLATVIIAAIGRCRGSEVLRRPVLKSVIC